MAPSFRTTWLGLVLLALGAWVVAGSAWDGSPANAESTLGTPRLKAQFVAMRDHDDDGHDDEHDGDHEHEDEEEYEDEDFEEELERAHLELEFHQAELRATFGGLELVEKLVEIAADTDKTAALIVFSASDAMEPSDLIPFLEDVVARASSGTVHRAARMQLVEAYQETDQPEKAMEQMKALVLGN